MRTTGSLLQMQKWKVQAETIREAITKVVTGGGLSRSSDEVFVMNMERRA